MIGNRLESCFATVRTHIESSALDIVSVYASIIAIESAYLKRCDGISIVVFCQSY